MPDWKKNGMRCLKASLIVSVLAILPVPCLADVMNFQNGKIVQGKLERLTGDIIEFKETRPFGGNMHVNRIQLTNRHDIVAVHGLKRYFGEIIYLDRFKLELKTATGLVNLSRLSLTDIIMGSPAEEPVSNMDIMHLAPNPNSPKTNGGSDRIQFPAGDEPLPRTEYDMSGEEWNDQGAIPAVKQE
jgi:hypothetical protein